MSDSFPAQCEDWCSEDSGCKGYAIHNSTGKCQLATISSCRFGCLGPYNDEHKGQIDPKAVCNGEGDWNGGCMIKSGTLISFDMRKIMRIKNV